MSKDTITKMKGQTQIREIFGKHIQRSCIQYAGRTPITFKNKY